MVAAGGFGLCAVDLCDARLRVPDAAWVRLQHTARRQGTSVLVAAATRALGTFAAAAVELGNGAPSFLTDGPPLWAGLRVRAARVRDRRPSATREPSATTREPSATREEGSPCVSLAFTCRS